MALYGSNKYSHGMTAEATCKARHLVQNTHTSVPFYWVYYFNSYPLKNILHNNYSELFMN